ncbi:conserved hypothetical protein [Paecilomyces variotii No. 5]|uniref:Xylanolytic transcriptional activator regulatory domain-containing protein n=1 Tax=Byssochlamys spectabilis (strain No. 5 / NBRC 109023) TaxID=1356009 RepID=V5FZD2_BYSSN|nr:conserved hypothetical protein [Paecilomyces variotii No. 5]
MSFPRYFVKPDGQPKLWEAEAETSCTAGQVSLPRLCLKKGQECAYIPSRRGGARTTRRFTQNMRNNSEDRKGQPLPVEQYIEPGAGLCNLDDSSLDSDFIFDSIFQNGQYDIMSDFQTSQPASPVVRAYQSDHDVLEAYYIYIHPYFPILPPPTSIPTDRPIAISGHEQTLADVDYEPSSPLSLAILSILSLIPHPDDRNPSGEDAVLLRRNYSECMAQSAFESINIETEVPASSTSPAQVLSEDPDVYLRTPFHQHVPIELESVIALSILSVYEYAQRGNIKRMRQRAGQAIMAAMDLSLHIEPEIEKPDEFTEARRRAWWMTYICVCQGSIVSVTSIKEPTISINDPRFTIRYPSVYADSNAWPFFIDTQRAILAATLAVIELNKALKTGIDLQSKLDRNRELDNEIKLLAAKADAYLPPQSSTKVLEPEESVVADCLKLIGRIKVNSARIKLNRYSAFFDLPLFSQKHCDLQPSSMHDGNSEPGKSPICLCSPSGASPPLPFGLHGKAMNLPNTPPSQSPDGTIGAKDLLGFGDQLSAKICLKAALNIAQCFERLPYPNPYGSLGASIPLGSAWNNLPRTMPSFACCAMQSSYSMLMVRQKAEIMHGKNSAVNPTIDQLYNRLQQGLQSVVGALDNYSIAFEALTGMRDQIKMMIGSSDFSNEG